MGDDSADGECLLRSADERHQFSRRRFAAAVLRSPRSTTLPNYGDTGATMGHELTHGFDDEGRQFDAQGNLRDWWTEEDAKAFEKRASCISDQYSQYVAVDDIKINGKLTLGEDIADLGGLILAYMAWQDDTKGERSEPLEGFTPAQRFFIAYGQSWCASTRDETETSARYCRPAFSGQVPRQWRSLKHAGVSGSISLQGGFGHGKRESLQGVVGRAATAGPTCRGCSRKQIATRGY